MPPRFRQLTFQLIAIGLAILAFPQLTRAAGDPAYGKLLYFECSGCHALGTNKTGPKLCGLIGRPAASIADFAYSDAMRASGLVWDEKTLDEYLAAPFKKVPETRMEYFGFPDAEDRFEMIEHLKVITDPSKCG